MAFVISDGSLQQVERPQAPRVGQVRLTLDVQQTYAQIWRTQPAVRTVVAFLARNIASLGLHTFQRVSDTDRVRLTDDPLAVLLGRPNGLTTPYRMWNATVSDLGIYDDAFWLKLPGPPYSVVRIPPRMVTPLDGTWLEPAMWRVKGSSGHVDYRPDQIVHFRGFNPDDERLGCSPIESLRKILVEEFEAGRMREQVLRNGARASGYIERPINAPNWRDGGGVERFRAMWHSQYSGDGPSAGGTPVLEDGMTFKPAAQTAEQLQYIEARKLTREEVAAAYFIPPPMVGILDNATYSNITQQHRMLYQDTLGPWLEMLQQEIELQLLPDVTPAKNVYVEFNLSQKLAGSFEEQAAALQTLVGAPVMYRNEGRAKLNLSADPDPKSDQLITPLNLASADSQTDDAVTARNLVEMVQKVYLGVGTVLTDEEARDLLNRAGADLKPGPLPDPPPVP